MQSPHSRNEIKYWSWTTAEGPPTSGPLIGHKGINETTGQEFTYYGSVLGWNPTTPGSNATEMAALEDAAVGNISYTDTNVNTELDTLISGLSAGDTIRIYAPTDCYVNFSADNLETPPASSASMYFPAGIEKLTIPPGALYINVLRVSTNGTLNITKVS